jgi:hypothetical protein
MNRGERNLVEAGGQGKIAFFLGVYFGFCYDMKTKNG